MREIAEEAHIRSLTLPAQFRLLSEIEIMSELQSFLSLPYLITPGLFGVPGAGLAALPVGATVGVAVGPPLVEVLS